MKKQVLLRRADMARQLGVSSTTILHWTHKGLLEAAHENIGGRLYDLEKCRKVYNKIVKLKAQKKTLSEIKKILDRKK